MFFEKQTLLALALCLGLSHTGANASGQEGNVSSEAVPHYPVKNIAIQDNPNHLPVRNHESSIVFLKENMKEVKYGDNTWDIAGELFYDNYRWSDLVKQNKFLQEPGRLYHDTASPYFWYCLIKPGEKLVNYQPVQPQVINKDSVSGGVILPPPGPTGSDTDWSWLWWLLEILFILSLIFWISYQKDLKNLKDPVNSGPAQVEGGVDDEHAAQRAHNIATSQGLDPLRVTNIQRGRFFGKAKVCYADKPNGTYKRFSGEVGYRGTILRANGIEEVVYFLQGCGNDVRRGQYMTGINFVPDEAQPEVLSNFNATAAQNHASQNINEQPARPFNWKEKVLGIIEKAVDDDKKIFFEITNPDGSKFKFDSLNHPFDTKAKKPPVQDTGEKKA